MMRLMLLFLIISASCVIMNCNEEPSTTEDLTGVSDNTDPDTLQSKAENDNAASKSVQDDEETRISRSSSDSSPEIETPSDESSKLHSTEAPLKEKSTLDEIISETEGDKEVKLPARRTNSADVIEDDDNLSDNLEKQAEELPETSRSASETEERKSEDLSEASAESKLSDNEKASTKVYETDRSSETEEVNERSDESDLNEGLETRRMFSATDNIVVDTKMRADITSTAVEPEMKTALNQNLNTYNFNEFGTDSNIKLVDPSTTEPTLTTKTNMPTVTNLASQEIINYRYLPKFYPRPELGITFPNVNSDFQGPRDLPIYLKVKQDEYQSHNPFTGPQTTQFQPAQENKYFNPRDQQQYHPPQINLHAPGTFINKQFENLQVKTANQAPRQYQNHVPTDIRSFIENKQFANLNQGSRNQMQQFYQSQDKMNLNNKNFGDLKHEVRNEEIQERSSMPLSNNDPGNQYPLLRQPQEMIDRNILEKKQIQSRRFANPYSPVQRRSPQQMNILNTLKLKDDLIGANIKILLQKLGNASMYSRVPTSKSLEQHSNNNKQNYPQFSNPNYKADFSFFIPGF